MQSIVLENDAGPGVECGARLMYISFSSIFLLTRIAIDPLVRYVVFLYIASVCLSLSLSVSYR